MPPTGAEAAPAVSSAERVVLDAKAAAMATVKTPTNVVMDIAPDVVVADGEIHPDQESVLEADDPALTVTFSGSGVAQDLDAEITVLPVPVSATVGSETGGVVVSDPIEITAVTAAGKQVTSFPHEFTTAQEDETAPLAVEDFVAGVTFEFAVGDAAVKDLDPGTVRIVTRETAGEPWVDIPSYLDTETGIVHGEIDHLSQFAVIGEPFVPAAGPRVVLDPDDDIAFTVAPWAVATELPYNVRLANDLADMMRTQCLADVVVTRTVPQPGVVSKQVRAGMAAAHTPDLTVTIAFDALNGMPWGTETNGGTKVYSRGTDPRDNLVSDSLVAQLPGYTGRPAKRQTRASLPYAAFAGVPGAVAHLETLYLDHNFDRPVIDNAFEHVVAGYFTSLGMYLETQGFDCSDPVTGGWPARPSAAELARWRNLGHQNFLAYGADPVSFSTGNLVEDEALFTLGGTAGTETDVSLTYNSQDGRESRVGAGWSWSLGWRAQRFDDGSVMVVRGDGASFVFEPDGAGGYLGVDGSLLALREAGAGTLQVTSTDGDSWTFDAADIDGIGELTAYADSAGRTTTLTYGAPGVDSRFVPLTTITDPAGRVILVGSDATGRVSSLTHPDGRVWSLGYDGAGNLTSITDPDSRTRTFAYDASHQLLSAVDRAGVTYLVNEYDASGRVVKQWDAEGTLRVFTYDDAVDADGLRRTTYTDNEGVQTVYFVDALSRVVKTVEAGGVTEMFTYDANNQVVKHIDALGGVTAYTYDDGGRVLTQTDPQGAVTRYTYTPGGELASTTDEGGVAADGTPDGSARTISFEVSPQGQLLSETYADGSRVSYGYDAAGNQTTITTPSGSITTFTYDARGNVISETDPLGHATTYAYDSGDRLVSMTEPDGSTTTFAWDLGDRLTSTTDALGHTTSYTYDANDHVISRTDPDGGVSHFGWDALFRLVSETAPDGGVTTYRYDREDNLVAIVDPLGAETVFELDDAYNPVTVIDPLGGRWERVFDAAGQVVSASDPLGGVTTYSYDEVGQLVGSTDALGASAATEYDAVGRVLSEVDAAGAATTFGYTIHDQLAWVRGADGGVISTTYDIDGNATSVTDPRGQVWSSAYDSAGQTVSQTDPLGGVSAYEYDPVGNLVLVTDAAGGASASEYDGLGQLIAATDPTGRRSQTEYDSMGRVVATVEPGGARTQVAYDPVGQVLEVTDATGAKTQLTWDLAGNQTSTTDPLGTRTEYRYDVAGQLVEVVEGAVSGVAPDVQTNVSTLLGYDAVGNLVSTTDGRGSTSTTEYDLLGQVSAEVDPLGGVTSFVYDELGRLVTRTDATGAATSLTYTPQSLPESISYSDGTGVELEWDALGNQIAMTDPTGATGWVYDELGRLVSQTDSNGSTIGYEWDATSSLASLTLPSGDQIGYSHDGAGRVTEQTSPWGNISYGFDEAGRTIDIKRTSGLDTTYAYDALGQTTQITHQTPAVEIAAQVLAGQGAAPAPVATGVAADGSGCMGSTGYLASRQIPTSTGVLCVKAADYLNGRTVPQEPSAMAAGAALSLNYSYDASGSVVDRVIDNGTVREQTTFSYDRLARLTQSVSEKSNGMRASNSYSYDGVGNRTSWTTSDDPSTALVADPATTFASYDRANRLVSTRSSASPFGVDAVSVDFAYDATGSRTSATTTTARGDQSTTSMTYGPTGQLASVVSPDQSSKYSYDGLGRQTAASTTTVLGTSTTTNTYDGSSLLATRSGAGGEHALVRDALGQLALDGDVSSGTGQWALLDSLGSTLALAGGDGQVEQLAQYSDFGVQSFDTNGWDTSLGFTGQVTDASSGLDLFHSRAYDPVNATWVSADTFRGLVQAPQSLNRYAYVLNSPVSDVDIMGFWPGQGLWDKGTKFVSDHAREIAQVAVGVGVGIAVGACIAATAGICAAAAPAIIAGGMAVGAAAGAGVVAVTPGPKNPGAFFEAAAWGAVSAIPGGTLGKGVAKVATKGGIAGAAARGLVKMGDAIGKAGARATAPIKTYPGKAWTATTAAWTKSGDAIRTKTASTILKVSRRHIGGFSLQNSAAKFVARTSKDQGMRKFGGFKVALGAQRKHLPGTNASDNLKKNYIEAIKARDSKGAALYNKSQFFNAQEGIFLTRLTAIFGKKSAVGGAKSRTLDFGIPVGSPFGGGMQTSVTVRSTAAGAWHGFPSR